MTTVYGWGKERSDGIGRSTPEAQIGGSSLSFSMLRLGGAHDANVPDFSEGVR
jgi:hypothetical protein